MIISLELETNPGENALFVAEVKLEKNSVPASKWWGLWFAWWLYPARLWRSWLWNWELVNQNGWRSWQVRLLGFEINWQYRQSRY